MKKTINILLFSFVCLTLFGQQRDSDDRDDEHYHEHHDFDFEIHINKNSSLRFGLLDLGVSTYISSDNGFSLPVELNYLEQRLAKSTNVNIGLVRHRIDFRKRHVSFDYGLSINSMKYYFENEFIAVGDADSFEESLIFIPEQVNKNRLMTNYLTLPMGFSYRSEPHDFSRSFHLSLGAYVGFLMNSNFKYKVEGQGKVKIKDDFGLTKFVSGLQARIGFGPFSLYCQYALNNMFQKNEGPELRQFNVGLSVIPF